MITFDATNGSLVLASGERFGQNTSRRQFLASALGSQCVMLIRSGGMTVYRVVARLADGTSCKMVFQFNDMNLQQIQLDFIGESQIASTVPVGLSAKENLDRTSARAKLAVWLSRHSIENSLQCVWGRVDAGLPTTATEQAAVVISYCKNSAQPLNQPRAPRRYTLVG